MGAGVSSSRRSDGAPRTPQSARVHPRTTPPRSPQLRATPSGVLGTLRRARNLETTIDTLAADLSAAKAKLETTEKALRDAEAVEAQQGVPHTECVVCMAACTSTVLLPCGHLCLCSACAKSLQANVKNLNCPLCRTPVDQMHRIFLPVEGQSVHLPPLPPPKPPPEATPVVPVHVASSDAACQVTPRATPRASPRASPRQPRPPRQAESPLVGRGGLVLAGAPPSPTVASSPPPPQPQPRIFKRPNSAGARRSPGAAPLAMLAINQEHPARPSTAVARGSGAARGTQTVDGVPVRTLSTMATDSGSGAAGGVGGSPRVPAHFDFVLPGSWQPRQHDGRHNPLAATWS